MSELVFGLSSVVTYSLLIKFFTIPFREPNLALALLAGLYIERLSLLPHFSSFALFKLQTLGGVALFNGAGTQTETIRRRLALLAILAAGRQPGVSRDKLIAYLWPESRTENGRHSLEQLLYGLRTQIHREVVLGVDPLRLNGELLATDVDDFERAFEIGDFAMAASLYRGPFLDGFFLSGSAEFEEWAAQERSRLHRQYAITLERLAAAHAEQKNLADAIECWQKLVALDPLSARATLGLLRALVVAGDFSAARQQAQVYQALVERDLGSAADPSVLAFVNELDDRAIAQESSHHQNYHRAGDSDVTRRRVVVSNKKRWIASAAGVFALIAVLAGVGSWRNRTAKSPLNSDRVLVLPFRVTGGDASIAYLREGMVDLFATSFGGEGGPRVIDPRASVQAWHSAEADGPITEAAMFSKAAELGAGQLLLGEIVATRLNHVVMNGKLFATANQRLLAQASVTGHIDSILPLADRLARQLLALRAGEDQQRLTSLMTTSPAAVAAFLAGRAERRRGHEEVARGLFTRALEHDSTFALAALELVLSVGRVLRWNTYTTDSVASTRLVAVGQSAFSDGANQVRRALEIAWRERARMSGADQLLLEALHSDYPRVSTAREILTDWERAATTDRVEAHYWLGRLLFYQGPALGIADAHERAEVSFNRAFALDSSYLGALNGLIEIAAFRRDHTNLRRLARLSLARDSVGSQADFVRWRVATIVGDSKTLREVRARFDDLDVLTLGRIQWVTQMDGIALEDGERASAIIVRRATHSGDRQIALYYARMLMLNRGRPNEALRLIALKREVEPNAILKQAFELRDALFWDGNRAAGEAAQRAFDQDLASASSAKAGQQRVVQSALSVAIWRLWHDDTTGVGGAIARLKGVGNIGQAQTVDAMFAAQLRRYDAAAALAQLDTLALHGCCPGPHFVNLIAARLHERAGNRAAALAAVRRGRWLFAPEHLSTYLREEGRLAALTGDDTGAIRAYRHYLMLRSTPEPSVQLQVARVRHELAALERRASPRLLKAKTQP